MERGPRRPKKCERRRKRRRNEDGESIEPRARIPKPPVKWLHAGILPDVQTTTKDVWYRFRSCRKLNCCDGWHLDYAMDPQGTRWKNKNVGLRKRDLITWDHEHVRGWYHLLSPEGTWQYGCAIAGRKIQRQSLLAHWRDPRSRDRYPDGTAHYGFLGPPVNVVHSVDDMRVNPIAFAIHIENMRELTGPYYPHTGIPLSTDGIDLSLFKQEILNPIGIVTTFVTASYAIHADFVRQRERTERMIESAFFALGYRIDRAAMAEANEQMRQGAPTAFHCRKWRQHQPLRVDKYKGSDLKKCLRRWLRHALRHPNNSDVDDSDSDENDDDHESDDETDDDGDGDGDGDGDDGGRCKRRKGTYGNRSQKKNRHGKEATQEPKDESDGDVKLLNMSFTSNDIRSKRRKDPCTTPILRRLAAEQRAREEGEDTLGFLPESSSLKGKGIAMPRSNENDSDPTSLSEDAIKEEDPDDLIFDEAQTAAVRNAKRARAAKEMSVALKEEFVIIDSDDEDGPTAIGNYAGESMRIPTPIPSPSAASLTPDPSRASSINGSQEPRLTNQEARTQHATQEVAHDDKQDATQKETQDETQESTYVPTQNISNNESALSSQNDSNFRYGASQAAHSRHHLASLPSSSIEIPDSQDTPSQSQAQLPTQGQIQSHESIEIPDSQDTSPEAQLNVPNAILIDDDETEDEDAGDGEEEEEEEVVFVGSSVLRRGQVPSIFGDVKDEGKDGVL